MKKNLLSLVVSSVVTVTALPVSFAETLDVDWLYFSGFGSWVARSELINGQQTQVQLPVANLNANQFWWQSSNQQTQLIWQQPDTFAMPQKGNAVEINGEAGVWIVKEVAYTHLVLQQGRQLRYWPQTQWHLLEWTTTNSEYGFELTVLQPENTRSDLMYAWIEEQLSAQVRYRLSMADDEPVLYQELIVSNLSENDFRAPGYSFAQTSRQPVLAMRASSTMEMAADMVSSPVAGESQGVPTLVSDEPVTIQAGSHVWLPVSATDLSLVERRYQIQWDTRSQGMQQAQSTLRLETSGTLPDIQGPIKLGVFDQQIALLESQYQPTDSKTADLNLGSSMLVNVTSELVNPNEWTLVFSNRSEEAVELSFIAQHWNGNTQQRFPMTVNIPANSERTMTGRLNANGQFRLSN